jgi:hypothetical protein
MFAGARDANRCRQGGASYSRLANQPSRDHRQVILGRQATLLNLDYFFILSVTFHSTAFMTTQLLIVYSLKWQIVRG